MDGRWLDVFVIGKTQDALGHTFCHQVRALGEDFSVQVEEPGFDDRSDRIRVDLIEGMVFPHIARNTAGVEGHVCCRLVAVDQAGSQTVGAVDIIGIERCCDLKTGRLIVDIFARIIMDGNNSQRPIAVQAGIILAQQIY